MAQEIVFYHSAMTGAPSSTLTAAGAFINVLDACLKDGFNSNSISVLTQSAGTATATTSGTNGFNVGEWVEIAGATPSAYNGRVKVLSKPASNQFTFAIASGTSSPASGTMTAKYPGAGWTKSSGGTNIAAYQNAGTGHWMQIEDNNPYADGNLSIRTRMAAGWTSLDSATVQLGNQIKFLKLTGGWIVVADAKTCYVFFGNIAASGTIYSFVFGDIAPTYGADAFHFFSNTGEANGLASLGSETVAFVLSAPAARFFPVHSVVSGLSSSAEGAMLRGVSQIGSPVPAGRTTMGSSIARFPGGSACCVPQEYSVPLTGDNSIPVSPMFCSEYSSAAYTLRGRFRGIYWPLGGLTSGFTNSFQRLDSGLIDGVSQPLVLVNFNNFAAPTGATKQVAFQVDGAWS